MPPLRFALQYEDIVLIVPYTSAGAYTSAYASAYAPYASAYTFYTLRNTVFLLDIRDFPEV